MKARDLTPGDTFVEDGHQFTVTEVVLPIRRGWSVRIHSVLAGGVPHVHLLAPDTEMDTR